MPVFDSFFQPSISEGAPDRTIGGLRHHRLALDDLHHRDRLPPGHPAHDFLVHQYASMHVLSRVIPEQVFTVSLHWS